MSIWFPSFREAEMMPRTVSVLRQFPFSPVREGITYLSVHPVAWSEPTVLERRFTPGISPEEAVALGFPPGDYIPRTLEQKIVCFADKMLDGDKARPFEEEAKRFVKKGHDVQRLRRLKEDVDAAVGTDAESIVLLG